MTISSTTRVAGPFSGDGSTATFPFTFKVFAEGDLHVASLNTATGVISVLALTADYTVALNADQDSSPGGSITLTAGNLAAGYTLTITTDMEALQGLDLTNAGGFYPDVVNAALDTLTILIQQTLDQLGRALQAPLVDGAPDVTLPAAAERAGKLLMFDANGNLSLVTVAAGGTVPGVQTPPEAVGNTDFTFQASSTTTPEPIVFAAGIFQTPGVDYAVPATNVGGTTWKISFLDGPPEGPISILLLA